MTVAEAITPTPSTAFELLPTGLPIVTVSSNAEQLANQAGLARKRRREKMRGTHLNPDLTNSPTSSSDILLVCAKDKDGKGILPPKKRKYSIDHPDSTSSIVSNGSSVGGENPIPAVVKSGPTSKVKVKTSTKPRAPRKQMRYDPDVPMTKEEASAWRREARRVRNRESAAASRRKIRNRIEDLEEEVEKWKLKYENLMKQLKDKRSDTSITLSMNDKTSSQTPEVSLQTKPHTIIVPELSSSSPEVVSGSEAEIDVVNSIGSTNEFSKEGVANRTQHLMKTIVRPAES